MAPAGWRSGTIPGPPVPSVAEGVRRRPDGSLAEVTVTFPALARARARAADLPAAGDANPGSRSGGEAAGTAIENAVYLVTADPARGGTVSITDKRTGTASSPGRATSW